MHNVSCKAHACTICPCPMHMRPYTRHTSILHHQATRRSVSSVGVGSLGARLVAKSGRWTGDLSAPLIFLFVLFFLLFVPIFYSLFFLLSAGHPLPGPTQGWSMLPAAIYKTRSVVRDLVQLQPSPRSTRVVDSQKRPAASSVGASSDKATQTAKKPRGAASPDPLGQQEV